jgi:protein kinase-like protein
VHRDVKPANVIVTEDGRAKIMDFGVAKLALTELTIPGQVLGTPSYMSPEQLTGEPVDGRSDLFSLGIVLYLMLTGSKPFAGDSVNEIALKIVQADPKPPSQVNPALNAEFDYVVAKAMAKRPADRYQTGQQLAADLEDLRQGVTPRTKQAATGKVERTQAQRAMARPGEAGGETLVMGSTQSLTGAHVAPTVTSRLQAIWHLPLAARIALMVGVLLVLGAGLGFVFRGGRPPVGQDVESGTPAATAAPVEQETAELHLHGVHPFHSGELTVYVDDAAVQIIPLHGGGVRKRFFFSKGVSLAGSFDRVVSVPAGDHQIKVRIVAGEFDQAGQIEAQLPPHTEKMLEVSVRRREVHLEWR